MKQPKAFFHIILIPMFVSCVQDRLLFNEYGRKKSETVVFSADNVTSVTSQNNGLLMG